MRVSLEPFRALLLTAALGLLVSCANKQRASSRPGSTKVLALPDLPEPAGVLAELSVAHPDATYRALRELGRPLSGLLPAGFPMLTASALGVPPLSADSIDTELPAVAVFVQEPGSALGWVLAVHVVSGPELVAKLCTGDRAPFHCVAAKEAGLHLVEPSAAGPSPSSASLAVFDNYLLASSSAELLHSAGPYTARTLPRRPPAAAPIALRFSKRALESNVVPALRALWAGYRTRLAQTDQSDRSAHGGRAPDFADPAQVILGADALVESVFSLVDGAQALELDVEPFPNRLDSTVLLVPEAGSEVQTKLGSLATGNAQALLALPSETQFALGLSRTGDDRESAGKAAGDDWVRLLGARLSQQNARQLRAVLADWEFGRGTRASYGFLGGAEPGAFLVTDVADAVRLKRAAPGMFDLLAVPGLRAPLAEFLGKPSVSEGAAAPDALPGASRKKLTFAASGPERPHVPPLSFAWLVSEREGFAAAGKNADAALKVVVQSARGEHATLATSATIGDSVSRIGEQAAVFAFADARLAFGASGGEPSAVAPVLLALGKREAGAYLRLEVSKAAVDLALHGAVGQ